MTNSSKLNIKCLHQVKKHIYKSSIEAKAKSHMFITAKPYINPVVCRLSLFQERWQSLCTDREEAWCVVLEYVFSFRSARHLQGECPALRTSVALRGDLHVLRWSSVFSDDVSHCQGWLIWVGNSSQGIDVSHSQPRNVFTEGEPGEPQRNVCLRQCKTAAVVTRQKSI